MLIIRKNLKKPNEQKINFPNSGLLLGLLYSYTYKNIDIDIDVDTQIYVRIDMYIIKHMYSFVLIILGLILL